MSTITLTIPESTPIIDVIKFAASLGCVAEIDNGNYVFKPTAARVVEIKTRKEQPRPTLTQAEIASLLDDKYDANRPQA